MEVAPLPLAAQVRALRLSSGLTQAELAERAGISERTVSDLERGLRTSVYAATARRLAEALGIPAERRQAFLVAASRDRGRRLGADAAIQGLPFQYRSRVPVPLTRLIGRDADLAGVHRLLVDDGARLVTIVGAGGVGKTRLAIEAARLAAADLGAAVYFVDLSRVAEPASVLPAVAGSVGLPVVAEDLLTPLESWLDGRRSLLLLDTMEHVVDAAPEVAELVAASPDVRLLVTSRTALRVGGECQWPLGPLKVEAHGEGYAAGSPAVELFLERARAMTPDLRDDPESRALVAAICSRVDGLPLAIEIAAARVKHMSIPALLRNLDDRLAPLVGGRRDSPPRHQTMRDAMQWSYALLGATEAQTLRAFSVFRGGCTAEAVGSVLGHDKTTVLDALGALVDTSLVNVEHGAFEPRYHVLDLVAAFASEQAAAAAERETLQRSHAKCFLVLAERAEPHLRGSAQRDWLTRLLAEESNLRAAMTWSLDSGEALIALRLAGALWMFWRWAGLFADARRWLDAALGADTGELHARLPVLWGAGWLAFHQGDYQRTMEVGSEMIGLTDSSGARLQRRNAMTLIGNAALAMGRDEEAVRTLREVLALTGDVPESWMQATSLLNLATALSAAGQIEEAIELCQRAVLIYESIGDRNFAARAQLQWGYAALRRGDQAIASQRIGIAIENIRELGDLWSMAEGLEAVAALRADDEPERAATLAGAAQQAREHIAMRAHPADARVITHRLHLARAVLGGNGFDVAWRCGRNAQLDSMLALARDMASVADEQPPHSR